VRDIMSVAATVRRVAIFSTCDIMSATNMPLKVTIAPALPTIMRPASAAVPTSVTCASQ
jgi:hypothetical protein